MRTYKALLIQVLTLLSFFISSCSSGLSKETAEALIYKNIRNGNPVCSSGSSAIMGVYYNFEVLSVDVSESDSESTIVARAKFTCRQKYGGRWTCLKTQIPSNPKVIKTNNGWEIGRKGDWAIIQFTSKAKKFDSGYSLIN